MDQRKNKPRRTFPLSDVCLKNAKVETEAERRKKSKIRIVINFGQECLIG